jgi:hypothetical protein
MRVPLPKWPTLAIGTRDSGNHRLTKKEIQIANELDAASARVEEILRNTFDPKLLPLVMRGARAAGRLAHRPLALWIAWKIAASDDVPPKAEPLISDVAPTSDETTGSDEPLRAKLLIRDELPSDASPISDVPFTSDEPVIRDELLISDGPLTGDEPFTGDELPISAAPSISDEPPIRDELPSDAPLINAELFTRYELPISDVPFTSDEPLIRDDPPSDALPISGTPPTSDESPTRDELLSDAPLINAEPFTRYEPPIGDVPLTSDEPLIRDDPPSDALPISGAPPTSDESPTRDELPSDVPLISAEPFTGAEPPINNAPFIKEFKLMEWRERPQKNASSDQRQVRRDDPANWLRKFSRFLMGWIVVAVSGFALVWYLLSSPWPLILTLRHLAAFPNCAATELVGLAPADSGQPGYWSHNDADGDGVACKAYPPNQ